MKASPLRECLRRATPQNAVQCATSAIKIRSLSDEAHCNGNNGSVPFVKTATSRKLSTSSYTNQNSIPPIQKPRSTRLSQVSFRAEKNFYCQAL